MPLACRVLLASSLLALLLALPSMGLAQGLQQPDLTQPSLRGLVAWWRGLPGYSAGDKFYDLIGRQDAVLTTMGFGGTSGWTASDRRGGAWHLAFDGNDDYAAVPGTEAVYDFANTTFTIMLWFRSTLNASSAGRVYLVDKRLGDTTVGGWFVGLDDAGTLSARIIDSGNTNAAQRSTVTTTLHDGAWHHIAVVMTTDTTTPANNDVTLYLAGVLDQGSRASSGALTYSPCGCVLTFGSLSDQQGGSFLQGALDDVRLYNRGLGAAEIAEIARMGPLGDPGLWPSVEVVSAAPAAAGRGSFFPFFPR